MNRMVQKSNFVSVNGIRLHYLDSGGSGPTLIFLAGMGSSAYIYNIAEFQSRFPQAKTIVIPGGHHYCFIAHEEWVYREMRKFLLD